MEEPEHSAPPPAGHTQNSAQGLRWEERTHSAQGSQLVAVSMSLQPQHCVDPAQLHGSGVGSSGQTAGCAVQGQGRARQGRGWDGKAGSSPRAPQGPAVLAR